MSVRAVLQRHWDNGLRWFTDDDGELVFTHTSRLITPDVPNRNGDVFTAEAIAGLTRADFEAVRQHTRRVHESSDILINQVTADEIRAWGVDELDEETQAALREQMRRGDYETEFTARHSIGPAIGHTAGLARADFGDIGDGPADRIRGLRSNVVVMDEVQELAPSLTDLVIAGFGNTAGSIQERQQQQRDQRDREQLNAALFDQLARDPGELPPPRVQDWTPTENPEIPQHHRVRASWTRWLNELNETTRSPQQFRRMANGAADAVNDWTRQRIREDGFYRRIMPPIPISNDELDRSVPTDLPVRVVDREEQGHAAISIPFATLPTNLYIRGPRLRYDRIVTPRFRRDVDEMRIWDMEYPFSDEAPPGRGTYNRMVLTTQALSRAMGWEQPSALEQLGLDFDDDENDDDGVHLDGEFFNTELGEPYERPDRHTFRDREGQHRDCQRGTDTDDE